MSDWRRVRGIAPGTQITIDVEGSRSRWFYLTSDDASLTALVSVDAPEPIVVRREAVRSIRRQPTKHVGRHAIRGALVGAAAVAVVAGGAGMTSNGVILGGAFGSWVGALVGVIAPRRADLIYRAR